MASLKEFCPGRVLLDIDLSKFSWWRIGGRAKILVRPVSVEEVASVRRFLDLSGVPSVVIGETTNLLFSSEPVDVVLVQISETLRSFSVNKNVVTAASGISASNLARLLAIENLTGGEHFCDIPGTLGGLIAMNGGSNRKSIGDSVLTVEVVSRQGVRGILKTEDCDFSYRSSIFQKSGDIIVGADLKFREGPGSAAITSEMERIRAERSKKFPSTFPNCGSIFKSRPDLYDAVGPPGEIIDSLGLRGFRVGAASISERHGNFFENRGGATSEEMLELICLTREKVAQETGFQLEAEVRFVSSSGNIAPADAFCPSGL